MANSIVSHVRKAVNQYVGYRGSGTFNRKNPAHRKQVANAIRSERRNKMFKQYRGTDTILSAVPASRQDLRINNKPWRPKHGNRKLTFTKRAAKAMKQK